MLHHYIIFMCIFPIHIFISLIREIALQVLCLSPNWIVWIRMFLFNRFTSKMQVFCKKYDYFKGNYNRTDNIMNLSVLTQKADWCCYCKYWEVVSKYEHKKENELNEKGWEGIGDGGGVKWGNSAWTKKQRWKLIEQKNNFKRRTNEPER